MIRQLMPHAFALLAAIVVPLSLTIDAIAQRLPGPWWIGPAIAAACTVPVVVLAKHARAQALLGAALAAMAAALSAEVPEQLAITADEQRLQIHDLREGPLPAGREGYVAVRGFLRSDWQVDEYRVARGQRPDQNEQARAVLVPLLGTNAEVIAVEGEALERVIIARIAPTQLGTPSLVSLRGRVGPVSPEIVDSLFAVQIDGSGLASASALRPEAVLLDTLEVPTRGQAITRLGLAIGAGLLAWVLLVLAVPRGEAEPA
ncbi:MAG: hypothetical protein R6X02_13035 [Enhygromyxa sp.]